MVDQDMRTAVQSKIEPDAGLVFDLALLPFHDPGD
jgi:hypothetical protein